MSDEAQDKAIDRLFTKLDKQEEARAKRDAITERRREDQHTEVIGRIATVEAQVTHAAPCSQLSTHIDEESKTRLAAIGALVMALGAVIWHLIKN